MSYYYSVHITAALKDLGEDLELIITKYMLRYTDSCNRKMKDIGREKQHRKMQQPMIYPSGNQKM